MNYLKTFFHLQIKASIVTSVIFSVTLGCSTHMNGLYANLNSSAEPNNKKLNECIMPAPNEGNTCSKTIKINVEEVQKICFSLELIIKKGDAISAQIITYNKLKTILLGNQNRIIEAFINGKNYKISIFPQDQKLLGGVAFKRSFLYLIFGLSLCDLNSSKNIKKTIGDRFFCINKLPFTQPIEYNDKFMAAKYYYRQRDLEVIKTFYNDLYTTKLLVDKSNVKQIEFMDLVFGIGKIILFCMPIALILQLVSICIHD